MRALARIRAVSASRSKRWPNYVTCARLRTLIARLADPSETIVAAAQKALVVLTGQDFGFARGSGKLGRAGLWNATAWSGWWRRSDSRTRALRALAGEELKQLTQQYFGYHPALPKKDRELAQRKYREWWEREGRALFTKR